MKKMVDLFTGLAGFTLAGHRTGKIETIFTSEIDSYNVKFIAQNLELENAGDINFVCVSESDHPYSAMCEEIDFVPSEKFGFSSLTMDDFMNGVVEWPDVITGGFPCQDISSCNIKSSVTGINGARSGLVTEQLPS